MKKLKFNSTLNHKAANYKTYEVIVEKVVTVYGRSFSELKDHPMRDNSHIAENRDYMYVDSDDVSHCLLLVDYDSGDGILVESEGSGVRWTPLPQAEAPTEATAETQVTPESLSLFQTQDELSTRNRTEII